MLSSNLIVQESLNTALVNGDIKKYDKKGDAELKRSERKNEIHRGSK